MTDENVSMCNNFGQSNKCFEHTSIHYMVSMWESHSQVEGGYVSGAANSTSSNHRQITRGGTTTGRPP